MRYTQDRLAELLGVKPNSISNYENEVSEPTIDQIALFIKIFDITADDLLFKDLSKNKYQPLSASEPPTEYKSGTCKLCKEKDHTIQLLEELNELLREKISAKVS